MVYDKFIINNEIIFDANSYELKPLTAPKEVITLNAPTARCLQLLLEHDGQVVSRDDFLEQVWNARGIVVSQNTFYQNISLLRKSLKKVGLDEEMIVTVRRKGFILSSDTQIKPLEDQNIITAKDLSGIVSEPHQYEHAPPHAITHPLQNVSLIKQDDEQVKQTSGISMHLPRWIIFLLIIFIVVEVSSILVRYL